MLTRLLQKVQCFVIQNPTIAMTLYTSFNEIFNSEVEKLKEPQIGLLLTWRKTKNAKRHSFC